MALARNRWTVVAKRSGCSTNGTFYAGVRPAWSNTVLRELFSELGPKRRLVAWIDLHTGLGALGHGEKIYVGDTSVAAVSRAHATWGPTSSA